MLTDSPGLAPEEVELFVTFPVETAMSGLPRINEVRSLTKLGLSVVTVVFAEGTDVYWARQQVSERLAEAREAIPQGLVAHGLGVEQAIAAIRANNVNAGGYIPFGGEQYVVRGEGLLTSLEDLGRVVVKSGDP